jgi:hypothetical protein
VTAIATELVLTEKHVANIFMTATAANRGQPRPAVLDASASTVPRSM